jgi:hypothetical protein
MEDKDSPAVDKDVRLEREEMSGQYLAAGDKDRRVDGIGLQPY